MAKKNSIVVGLDIGTSKVCAVVGEMTERGVEIIGIGSHPSQGLRKGVVINIEATVNSLKQAIEGAGLMANVGLLVSHDRHHLHSYYVIRNAEALTGFTDEEVEVMAQVARYHRKSGPKPTHVDFANLPGDAQHVVRVLAGMLRVGIALDRTRSGSVRDIEVELTKRQLRITPIGGGDMALECYTADARKGLLEEALGLEVVVG